jgi:hypothetical protein
MRDHNNGAEKVLLVGADPAELRVFAPMFDIIDGPWPPRRR